MSIKNNTINLENILNKVKSLPESGINLPTLSNEGTAADLLSGKQLIDGEGNVVTGAFSIDEELSTQDDLIAQIQAAVDSLPEAGGNDGNIGYDTYTLEIVNNSYNMY